MTDKSSPAAVKGFLQKRFQFLACALLLLRFRRFPRNRQPAHLAGCQPDNQFGIFKTHLLC